MCAPCQANMDQYKGLQKESREKNMSKIDSGWLAPDGHFTKCKSQEHIATAKEIAGNNITDGRADEYLLNHGYVKIYRGSFLDHHWHIVWYYFLTDAQKSFLRQIFEDAENDIDASCIERWSSEN